MSATTATSNKENNKNVGNTGSKKFMGGNASLNGKVFDVNSREAVHQFSETVKAIANYIGQEYMHGGDLRYMIKNFDDFNLPSPPYPQNNAGQFEIESWKKQLDIYWKRKSVYSDNKMNYSLIWGQSTKSTQSKTETHQEYRECKVSYDSLKLLKIIREIIFKSDDRQYKYKAEDQAKRVYYLTRQTPEMSCQEYFERVRNIVDVIMSLGGSLCDDLHLIDELPEREPRGGYTEEQKREAQEKIHNNTMAYGILVRAGRARYGKLIEEVEKDYLKGHNNYPKTATEAYNLLVNYKNYGNLQKRNAASGGSDQVAFITEAKITMADGTLVKYPHIKCF
jgi:hypothetical protein